MPTDVGRIPGDSRYSVPTYARPNKVMALGDSITVGLIGASAAIHNAGYRWVLDQAATAAGRNIAFQGLNSQGTFANNLHQAQNGQTIDQIRTLSAAARAQFKPEGMLYLCGINNISPGGTAAATAAFMRTTLTEIWATGAGTLQWMAISTLMRYDVDLVTINPVVIDYNTNHLPVIVSEQRALGRDVFLVDGYTAVLSLSDGLHPDDAGYTQLAGVWMPAISPRLRAST